MKFSANVGGWDRGIRIVLGLVLLVLGLTNVFSGALEVIAYIVAAIALITGIVTFCPANALFGINTRRVKTEPEATAEEFRQSGNDEDESSPGSRV